MAPKFLCIIGPTASGKSARAVTEAKARGGEVISVDSRQVYRGLDIGTEKITTEEMGGVPHHLIDIREPEKAYSAHEFVGDATRLIHDIAGRGKLPILAGGTHFYFNALLHGLPPETPPNDALRHQIKNVSDDDLFSRIKKRDPVRAASLDPKNRRRLIRALEIIEAHGTVPQRTTLETAFSLKTNLDANEVEWIVLDVQKEELRTRIDARLAEALARGLTHEVREVRARVGDARLNEFGLEYRIVGEFLRKERTEESLLPTLSAKLWQYARRQKAWMRKLQNETITPVDLGGPQG